MAIVTKYNEGSRHGTVCRTWSGRFGRSTVTVDGRKYTVAKLDEVSAAPIRAMRRDLAHLDKVAAIPSAPLPAYTVRRRVA